LTPPPSSVPPYTPIYKHSLTSLPGVTQTFANTLYGPTGFLIYTVGISLSALGSINSNVFAVGRLAVTASRRDYIPGLFSGDNSIGMSVEEEEGWLRVMMRERWPAWVVWCVTGFARATGRLRLEKGVPV
jgi:amino acid transporter